MRLLPLSPERPLWTLLGSLVAFNGYKRKDSLHDAGRLY